MSIWHGNPTLEAIRSMQGGLTAFLGIQYTEIGDDFLRGTMPVTPQHVQPMGLLHGGASVTLAETLGSTGANMVIDRSRFACVGQEINANHLRPGIQGTVVTGTARPIYIGSRSQVWGIEIHNERQQLICISRITMAMIDRPLTT